MGVGGWMEKTGAPCMPHDGKSFGKSIESTDVERLGSKLSGNQAS